MATSTKDTRKAAHGTTIPISLCTLRPGVLDFDVYVRRECDNTPVLYSKRGEPLKADDIDRLANRGTKTAYIVIGDEETYRQYVHDEVLQDKTLAPTRRYQALRDVNRTAFNAVYFGEQPDKVKDFAGDFSDHLIEIVCDENLLAYDLLTLMEHDDGTYTHSVNVSTYSVLLANRLGYTEAEDLGTIAVGALLHDIGKRRVQSRLLTASRNLTDEERQQIQHHPTIGFSDLFLREDTNWGELMMVYQHHERIDGSGYPVGIEGKDIHDYARICSIADVYHALTSERPYREPMSRDEALQHLTKEAGTSLDKEMVECWTVIAAEAISV